MTQTHGIVTLTQCGEDGSVVVTNDRGEETLSGDDVGASLFSGDSLAYCSACGDQSEVAEPDAEGFPCEGCGERGTVTSLGRILGLV